MAAKFHSEAESAPQVAPSDDVQALTLRDAFLSGRLEGSDCFEVGQRVAMLEGGAGDVY